MHRFFGLAVFLLGAALSPGGALAGPTSGVKLPESNEKLGTIDLPSGMRIVIEEDHSKPVVAVVAVIDVGAAADPVGKEGLAHLVEHLSFRAKPDGRLQRANQLDFAGASSWNGTTTHDLTTFAVVGPKESLRNLLVIEGGRLMGPLAGLDQHGFELERDVVKHELTARDERGEASSRRGASLLCALPRRTTATTGPSRGPRPACQDSRLRTHKPSCSSTTCPAT